MNSLADPIVVEVLDRLHREAEAQMPVLLEKVAGLQEGGQMPEGWAEPLGDIFLPVSREHGRFPYQTGRGVRAERVVESGSSFEISSIYLAAGLRGNGGRILIGPELLNDKSATADRNI
jgi:predicted O-methyltransferase YrrM